MPVQRHATGTERVRRTQARADRDGMKVSAVVRAALEEYVKEDR